jgi:peptidoglycan/xylan/chitin deacetylase (PgdA/CDA1 family)
MGVSVPVLTYHHVNPSREITPAGFEKQMQFLSSNGYAALSLEELSEFFRTGKLKQTKSVVITFDDGYLDNWVFAYPVLKKYDLKATIFVVTNKIQDKNYRDSFDTELDLKNERHPDNFLSWEQIRIMEKSGLIDIQAHTHYHYKEGESWGNTSNLSVQEELVLCRKIIEEELGNKSLFIAWPWGEYTEESIKTAKEIGFKGALSTKVGSNEFGSSAMEIKRFKVSREDLDWFRKRLELYSSPWRAKLYASFYGFDRKIRNLWK